MKDIDFFEQCMNYRFKNTELLQEALTHSSYANEKHDGRPCNERLEFFGDSVLGIIISEYLFKTCPRSFEGDLTRARATIVCEKSLAEAARRENIGTYLKLGRGEEKTGGRNRDSVLSDATEALIAALYLDAGFEKTKEWVLKILSPAIKSAVVGKLFWDYKTLLQEKLQSMGEDGNVVYTVTAEEGPDHNKIFEISAYFNNELIGKASGKSKKAAELSAAKDALEKLDGKAY